MSSIYTIGIIARYEMRTLLRAWFFRIFAALSIVSLAFYNMAIFIEASGAPWIYRALPAALPYANLIILNLGQAVVAVFLASEFLKQDKKNDTVEVIYARPMTNSEYIIGKAIGVLLVFFILNLVVLLAGIAFSFLSTDSSRGIIEYFFYPLLISIPTLVYVVGLSFFLMILIKNQAVTFILLIGYIALSVFYLNNKWYNLPDFIAYNVPMMHSTISGFSQLGEIILHRSIYLLLGLSLVFFTVYKLERLPQSGKIQYFPLIAGIFFATLGISGILYFLESKENIQSTKNQMIELNDRYASKPRLSLDSCTIQLEHAGKKIIVSTKLVLSNKNKINMDTFILSLNPGLEIHTARVNGNPCEYVQKMQIVILNPGIIIMPNERIQLELEYSGTINENINFLDQRSDESEENFFIQIYTFRKHYAWIKKEFVCLTRESYWYPVPGVGFSTLYPDKNLPDFTYFTLQVKTSNHLLAFSQGIQTKTKEGNYHFVNHRPLTQISLVIGEYIKYSVQVDSVEYGILVQQGNAYFQNQFTEIRDSISYLIRELRNEYEDRIGYKYPFGQFYLVEVPAEFSTDNHAWSISSEAVQPEMIFIPEKAIFLAESDFKRRKKREEERMKRDNKEILPEELQARIFKKFVRNNFMAEPDQYFDENVMNRNTYSIFPEFFSFKHQLNSSKWPILNIALQAYIKERNTNREPADYWWDNNIGKAEQISLELKQSSLNGLVRNGISIIHDDFGRITLNDLILSKGENLFSLLRARYGEKEFDQVLDTFIKNKSPGSFCFSEMDSLIQKSFGKSISFDVENWYNTKKLPGFLIKDIETYRIKDNDFTKYQIRFKLSNAEDVDGMVTIYVEMANNEEDRWNDDNSKRSNDFSKKIHMPAHSAKEIGLVFPSEPARIKIDTHISENLPNKLIYDFSVFQENYKSKPFDSIKDIEFFSTLNLKSEYLVDNEDSGFTYNQQTDDSYLKSKIREIKKNASSYKYARVRTWDPPLNWKPVIGTNFYGKYVRSAVYSKSGDGKQKAIWKAKLALSGNYDVYAHIVKISNQWERKKEKVNYNFRIYHDDGIEEISLFDQDIEDGWVYLGSFYISPENAFVELSNKSTGNLVIADAVKWVKNR